MATRPMKQITGLPGVEGNTYTFLQNDATLSVSGKAADAKVTGDKLDELKSASKLVDEYIPGTTQSIAFDSDGNVESITHTANGAAVRTDVYTFGTNTITEVRTLSTGESLTIVTNLDTLETTVTYAAA